MQFVSCKRGKFWTDVRWPDLTATQQMEVLRGDHTGHPSNKPRNVAEARRWSYDLSLDKSKIVGVLVGDAFRL